MQIGVALAVLVACLSLSACSANGPAGSDNADGGEETHPAAPTDSGLGVDAPMHDSASVSDSVADTSSASEAADDSGTADSGADGFDATDATDATPGFDAVACVSTTSSVQSDSCVDFGSDGTACPCPGYSNRYDTCDFGSPLSKPPFKTGCILSADAAGRWCCSANDCVGGPSGVCPGGAVAVSCGWDSVPPLGCTKASSAGGDGGPGTTSIWCCG